MVSCKRVPALWPSNRGRGMCGPFQIAAILKSRGIEAYPKDLYVNSIERTFDMCLPWDPHFVFQNKGLPTESHVVSRDLLFTRMIENIERDRPTMFLLRHDIHGKGRMHWISCWGYDASSKKYACYDSGRDTCSGGIGNFEYDEPTLSKAIALPYTIAITPKR